MSADVWLVVGAYLVGQFGCNLLVGLILSPIHARQVADRVADDRQPGRRRASADRGARQQAVGTASRPPSAWDAQVPPPWPVPVTHPTDATQPIQRVRGADEVTAQFGRIR